MSLTAGFAKLPKKEKVRLMGSWEIPISEIAYIAEYGEDYVRSILRKANIVFGQELQRKKNNA